MSKHEDNYTDSDSDSEYINKSEKKKRKYEKTAENNWLNDVREKIEMKNIKYADIKILDLDDENNIWFIERMDILDNLMKDTEEYYRMRDIIYDKYNELKNSKSCNIIKIINKENNMIDRIMDSGHSEYIKGEIYRRYRYVKDGDKTEEYYKTMEWIDFALSMPTQVKTDILGDVGGKLEKMFRILNEKIYGLDKVKEKILSSYCAMLTNPYYKKKFIALVGPPGVGKTELGRIIADVMDLPFAQISLGCIKDASTLIGHSSTYIGAKAGIIANIMQKMKYQNPVILLDELDKIQNTSEGNAVISVLLHVLDKTQNNKFQDMYMPEIPIDLSNVFFILAMNDKENIDANLKSRLCFIDIEGYTVSDKIKIGTEFILPKVLNNLMFHNMDIIIDTETMKYIIEKYSNNEKGVRNLEKSITGICEKLNTIKYINNNRKSKKIKLSFMINDLVFPLKLTKNIIDKLGEE